MPKDKEENEEEVIDDNGFDEDEAVPVESIPTEDAPAETPNVIIDGVGS